MAGIKVRIDRDSCIACGLCASTCPDVFGMSSDDGKSCVVRNSAPNPDSLGEGVVPPEKGGCVRQVASSCLVNAISVEEV